ncbi:hypothetical protein BH23GEM6_BH23GEM6_02430 [soil metagenome]
MNDYTPADHSARSQSSDLDTLLRDALPEIKLALGGVIDRENARSLPGKYARLLPESLLLVTLREDAATALAPVAVPLERELTDSCTRHGSLYDRAYRVQLRRAADPDAPLYSVSLHAGHSPAEVNGEDAGTVAPHADLPAVRADQESSTSADVRPLPINDPDATRIDDAGPAGWQPGRWLLLVEDENGEQHEVFRLADPFTTVGRRSDDPQLQTTVALSDVPHLSRRHLALLWEVRDGAPGFRVFNVGLNPVHLPSQEIPGAHAGKGTLDLKSIGERNTGWLPPGVPLKIGEHGPVLKIEEVPEEIDEDADVPDDPDATRYG